MYPPIRNRFMKAAGCLDQSANSTFANRLPVALLVLLWFIGLESGVATDFRPIMCIGDAQPGWLPNSFCFFGTYVCTDLIEERGRISMIYTQVIGVV